MASTTSVELLLAFAVFTTFLVAIASWSLQSKRMREGKSFAKSGTRWIAPLSLAMVSLFALSAAAIVWQDLPRKMRRSPNAEATADPMASDDARLEPLLQQLEGYQATLRAMKAELVESRTKLEGSNKLLSQLQAEKKRLEQRDSVAMSESEIRERSVVQLRVPAKSSAIESPPAIEQLTIEVPAIEPDMEREMDAVEGSEFAQLAQSKSKPNLQWRVAKPNESKHFWVPANQ